MDFWGNLDRGITKHIKLQWLKKSLTKIILCSGFGVWVEQIVSYVGIYFNFKVWLIEKKH